MLLVHQTSENVQCISVYQPSIIQVCYTVMLLVHQTTENVLCISVHQPSIIQVRYTKNIFKISRSSKDKNRRPYHHTRQKIVCRGGKGGRGGE